MKNKTNVINNNKFNSSMLRGFVTGLILGDGYIDKGVTKRAFRIKSINKDFIYDIEKKFKTTTPFKTKIHVFEKTVDKNNVNHRKNWELYIKANPYFAKLYHHFYDDYRKRKLSNKIEEWLNEIGLAYWYMSDGYITLVGRMKGIITNRRIEISTDRYILQDVIYLSNILKNKFKIDNSVIKRKNKNKYRYRIRILTKSYEKFINLIEPYIVESFKYKMNLAYNRKPDWMSPDFFIKQQQLVERSNPYK